MRWRYYEPNAAGLAREDGSGSPTDGRQSSVQQREPTGPGQEARRTRDRGGPNKVDRLLHERSKGQTRAGRKRRRGV